jgi:hypothetical protein
MLLDRRFGGPPCRYGHDRDEKSSSTSVNGPCGPAKPLTLLTELSRFVPVATESTYIKCLFSGTQRLKSV